MGEGEIGARFLMENWSRDPAVSDGAGLIKRTSLDSLRRLQGDRLKVWLR